MTIDIKEALENYQPVEQILVGLSTLPDKVIVTQELFRDLCKSYLFYDTDNNLNSDIIDCLTNQLK